MAMNADNLKSLVAEGNEMARAGHFDSAGILKAVKDFDRRCVCLLFFQVQVFHICLLTNENISNPSYVLSI
jgi:hypothetical protein